MNNKLLMLVAAATVATSSMQGSSYLPAMPSQKSVESAVGKVALVGGTISAVCLAGRLACLGYNSYQHGLRKAVAKAREPYARQGDVAAVDAKVGELNTKHDALAGSHKQLAQDHGHLVESVVALASARDAHAKNEAVKNWRPKHQQHTEHEKGPGQEVVNNV